MIHNTIRVIFFGSSAYCLPVIKSLETHFQLSALITKYASPIADLAKTKKITLFTPLNKQALLPLKEEIGKIRPDLALVADYGLIIPADIFSLPRHGTLNIHFSKLPEFRGASPVQYTILSGADSAWITFQKISEKIDTGEVIYQQKIPLQGREKTGELYATLFEKAAEILPEIINSFISNDIKLQKQDESKATSTKILQRDDGFIPWSLFLASLSGKKADQSSFAANSAVSYALTQASSLAEALERSVRALHPWPGVWTEITLTTGKKRLKIIEGELKDGRFNPITVQLEGKKPVSWKQFLAGYLESLPSTSSMALKSSLK